MEWMDIKSNMFGHIIKIKMNNNNSYVVFCLVNVVKSINLRLLFKTK